MLGIFRKFEFAEKCDAERERRRPAESRGLHECVQCGFCCWRKTCEIGPGELGPIAKLLGKAEAEVFAEFLVVDSTDGTNLLLRPRLMSQDGGKYLSNSQTFDVGQCALMGDDGKCKIHAAKPRSARDGGCWDVKGKEYGPSKRAYWSRDELAALGWDGDQYEHDDD